jgi:hypothetical protein
MLKLSTFRSDGRRCTQHLPQHSNDDAAVLVLPTRDATLITICSYENYQTSRRADVLSNDASVESKSTDRRRKEEQLNNKQLTILSPNGESAPHTGEDKISKPKPAKSKTGKGEILPDDWTPKETHYATTVRLILHQVEVDIHDIDRLPDDADIRNWTSIGR